MINSLIAVVLTHNEQDNVGKVLASVAGLCPIVVVDSGSTDDTETVCRRYTNHFLYHPYSNHAAQWSWALTNLPVGTKWVLALDADFVVSPALRTRLEREIESIPDEVAGIFVLHRYVFGGAEIRFGGAKKYWLRLIRVGRGRPDLSDLVDFRFIVDGSTISWKEKVIEFNRLDEDASFWIRKQDKFSLRLAIEEELRRAKLLKWEGSPNFWGNPDQRVMWLRDRWLNLPLYIRPCIYFVYRYVFRLGFLDGAGGFLYHAQQAFWMRLVVDWKLWQIRRLGMTPDQLLLFRDASFRVSHGSVKDVWLDLKKNGWGDEKI